MAEVKEHITVWDGAWDWSGRGDEWSDWWGGTEAMWHGALLPRIHAFLPAQTALEIAPGYGRWTQYLKDECAHLVVVDLAERCIAQCRERFAASDNIAYHVNDGRSLAMIADGSVDFAFSFDSLVHADQEVLDAYLLELGSKLAPDGVAFIHHSNLGHYERLNRITLKVPAFLRHRLQRTGLLIDIGAWRAEHVTAHSFAEGARRAGLACVSQEMIRWEHGRQLIDAISVVTRPGSRWHRPNRVLENPHFRRDGQRLVSLYGTRSYPGARPHRAQAKAGAAPSRRR